MSDKAASGVRLFISHHSSTYDTALQVEEQLARRGVSCWIAPRDVEPGEPFDKAISSAILGSAAILLLFCEKSDKSRHVKRELILADTAARPIIPLRLEAINPGELAYHLADSQWIDWIDRREAVMDRVANQARQYASVTPAIDGPLPQSHRPRTEEREDRRPPLWLWILGAIAALLAVIGVTWLLATRGSDESNVPAQTEAVTEAVEDEGDMSDDTASGSPDDTLDEGATEPAPTATPSPTPTSRPTARPTSLAPRPIATPTPTVTATFVPLPVQTAAPVQRVVSFCRGAGTDAEYLICAEPDLQARAVQMGVLIDQVREDLADDPDAARAFNSAQRRWYDGVRATCHDAACITRQQNERLAALRAQLEN